MQYCTYSPSNFFSRYIKYYWTLEGKKDATGASKERIFPDGSMELIFHYGDLFKKYTNEVDGFNQPRSFVHGQLKRFIEVEPTGNIGVFSIRFLPNGLHPFLGMDMDELTERSVSIGDLWGLDGSMLEEKIMEAPSTGFRIRIIEEFLLRRFKGSGTSSTPIDHFVHSILNSGELKPIELLCSEAKISRRQLERRFTATVGLSPKLLTRIARFQNTLYNIENKAITSLTSVAYSNGFYDQSHFIKDFREFTGINPTQYFTTDLEFAKYLTTR